MKSKLIGLVLVLMVVALTACSESDENHIQAATEHATAFVEHDIQGIECNKIIDFSSSDSAKFYLSNGLGNFEQWGRWSDGKIVTLKFLMPQYGCNESIVTFRLNGFVGEGKLTQSAKVFLNGDKIGDLNISFGENDPQDFVFNIPTESIDFGKLNIFEFNVNDPVSPKSLGLSVDPRLLGLGFKSVVFQ